MNDKWGMNVNQMSGIMYELDGWKLCDEYGIMRWIIME
jgi:hypothetical protein